MKVCRWWVGKLRMRRIVEIGLLEVALIVVVCSRMSHRRQSSFQGHTMRETGRMVCVKVAILILESRDNGEDVTWAQ